MIFGHLCVRNEADRYLEQVLNWHSRFLDAIHVYDDQSTDGSLEVARDLGAAVESRPTGVPPFTTDESAFRQAAWESMEALLEPQESDWVLCLDADEFFMSWEGEERDALEHAITYADLLRDIHAVDLRVDEIFDVVDGIPMRRTDGYWGDIHAVRLVRYRAGGGFQPKQMGGGSVPSYVDFSYDARLNRYGLVHFGYAEEADRRAKYQRYSSRAENGHSSSHIESILTTPTLSPLLVKDGVG